MVSSLFVNEMFIFVTFSYRVIFLDCVHHVATKGRGCACSPRQGLCELQEFVSKAYSHENSNQNAKNMSLFHSRMS